MVTRLFLHSATSGVAGTLPASEQSTLTSGDDFEANQATNRSMSRFRGTSQTSLVNTSGAVASTVNEYIGRWVSDPINQSGIAANTWTWNGAYNQSNLNGFPNSSSTDQDIYLNIYVWRPSGGGSKVGTIADSLIVSTAFGSINNNSERVRFATITGSAVAGAAAGDVIVCEVWNQTTQGTAAANTQTFYFDGTVVSNTTNSAVVSDHASFLQSPEDIAFTDSFVTTKLYLHATTTGIPSGTLPSAEQSTKTVTTACNFEGSQTTNRLMNTTIGTSQATLSLATPADINPNTFYVSRWVSPVIYQTSIAAGDWNYNFAASESSTSLNYPVNGTNKAVWVNCYVWKPSNGTKYGTILDGDTAATVTEGTNNQERSQEAVFTGAAVSSLTSGDACIVFEAWFAVTNGSGSSFTANFFYDGTTETAAGSTVSNHASLISYGGLAINFTAAGTNFNRPLSTETVTVSESIARLYGANRAPTAETNTIGEAIARLATNTRALTTETNTIGESLVRVFGVNRALATETVTISESIARVFVGVRALSAENTTIGESLARLKAATRALSAETTAISESLVRTFGVVRTLSDTVVIGESLARIYNAIRALSDTSAISESLAKVQVLVRSLAAQTTTIGGESLARILGAVRSLSDTTVIGESLARLYGAIRALATQTTTVSESLARLFGAVRLVSDTTIISETLARVYNGIRALATEITNISESLSKVHTPAGGAFFDRPIAAQTVAISESVVRAITNVRSLSQTTAITDSLTTLKTLTRSLVDTVIISETLSRLATLTRVLSTQITVITESLTAFFATGAQIRALVETIIISEVLARAQTLTRALTENVVISAVLEALKEIIIPLWKQPTEAIRPEGVGKRSRAWERESPLYLRKQLSRIVRRVGSLGRWRNSIG